MRTTELKRCPFCGSKARYATSLNGHLYAECPNCEASSRSFIQYAKEPTEQDVAEMWNRRDKEDELQQAITTMRDCPLEHFKSIHSCCCGHLVERLSAPLSPNCSVT